MQPAQKPDFPHWLQKRIPFLARAAHNPVYRAFRDRRDRQLWHGLRLPGFSGRRRSTPVGCAILLALTAISIIPLLLMSPFASRFQLLLFGALAVGALYVSILWIRGSRGRIVPNRASIAFNPEGMNADVALDLWMCGVTGRDIAEAVILENLETIRLSTAILQTLGVAVFLLVLLAPAPLLAQCLYVLVVIAGAFLNFRVAIGSFPCGSQKSTIPMLNARWRRADAWWDRFCREFPRHLRDFTFILVAFVTVVVAIIFFGGFLGPFILVTNRDVPLWILLQGLGAVLTLFLPLLNALLVGLFRRREARRLEKMLVDAESAFESYIRVEVLDDPDARRLGDSDFQLSSQRYAP